MSLRMSLWGLFLFAVLGLAPSFASEQLVAESDPVVAVIDGDTLEIDGQVIQLYGIDAPELGQSCDRKGHRWACGVTAAFALHKIVDLGRHSIACNRWRPGTSEQNVEATALQICKIGHTDVAESLLHEGYAVALPGSFPDYVEAEQAARKAGLGIWAGDFVLPWQWRDGKRLSAAPIVDQPCNIKGVVDADRGLIYFVPTDKAYKSIDTDPAKGGRVFCSDEEARRAGGKRPGEKTGPSPDR